MSALDASPRQALPDPYPVNLLVAGCRCLVVGGGRIGARKAAGLVRAGADVTVVAPTISDEVRRLGVTMHERPYRRGEVASYRLAITCTGDRAVDAQVFHDGEAAGIWVNAADDPPHCAFTLPAVARQGDLQVTVSTSGRSPALASWLRRRLERELDPSYAQVLDLLSGVRDQVRSEHGTSEIAGWDDALDAGLVELVRGGDLDAARQLLGEHLGLEVAAP